MLFELEDMSVELLLKSLVGAVDANLFKAVDFKSLGSARKVWPFGR
jgi:hypothetical protein